MMPHQSTDNCRICANCDGCPTAHIATGHTLPDGTRQTLAMVCPDCRGTGTRATSRALARTGR